MPNFSYWVERPSGVSSGHSNALWTPFDYKESWLGGRERQIGHYKLGEALESDRAYLFGGDASLQRDIDAGVPAVGHRAADLSRKWRAVLCYPSEDG
jgi:hypothetical protein